MTVCSLDFAFLSARFSLSDFPDFFDMDLRGDLSDIIGPSIGNLNGPDAATVRHIQLVPRIVDQHFMTIGGEVPTQAFAITRLLLAFLHRAVEGPVDQDDWEQLWATEELPMDAIRAYADRVRRRFDLFDPVVPFYQVASLRSLSGGVSHLRKIVADMPDPGKENLPLFTTRTVTNLSSMNVAEAARWLIQAFDPAGTKTGVVNSGSRYGSSLGWCGQIGGVLAQGKNLRETLVLNLVARDVDTYVRIGGPHDVPPWEREPDGPAWKERSPCGAIDLYTWQTRRVRLVGDRTASSALSWPMVTRFSRKTGTDWNRIPHAGIASRTSSGTSAAVQ
jgi:CRISPR type I-E-associated protein CasA/Cse1